MRGLAVLAAVLGGFLAGWGCGRGQSDPRASAVSGAWFEDRTREWGLDFVHDAGKVGNYFMPEVIGSGGAFLDYDQDGRLDIYILQNGGEGEAGGRPSTNRLYRQEPDGRLRDVSAGSGLDVAGRGMGVAVGDVNDDGFPDLVLTEYGRARLFLNRGGTGKFAEVTREAGIDNPAWGTAAAFLDHDRDGRLDLVVVNYVLYSPTRPCSDQAGRRDYCGPAPFPGSVARLFQNRGAASGTSCPRFEDITVRSGLGRLPGPGLGVVALDFDGDRWQDIFVANDGKANHLWMNQKDGTFREEALWRGLAYNGMGHSQANMGIAVGDSDQDGLFDLYSTHLTEEVHIFWKQEPRGQFHDRTAALGLANPLWRSTGFGAVLSDLDLDGFPDLAQANGRVKFTSGPSADPRDYWSVYRERNQLFANEGGRSFRDISEGNPALCGRVGVWRALAAGDYDGDGDLDLLVTEVAGPARLFRNVAPRRGHWLLVRAVDPARGGRDAIGAEVLVEAGGRKRIGFVLPSQSYLSGCDPRVHFGLGPADRVDSIEVRWPHGSEEVFPGGSADRLVTLRKGEGRPVPLATPSGGERP